MKIKLLGKVSFVIVLLSLFMFTIGFPSFSYAETEPFKKAPVNQAFLDFLKNGPSQIADDGHMLGHVPPVVDLSHVRGKIDRNMIATYPASYDLRTLGKLNPVRDQGHTCGSCWTFGTYASLESYLLTAETKDFSEQDLNAHHGFDYLECKGGNEFMSEAYLARWSGPLNESDVPYPYTSTTFSPVKHVQQVTWLPVRASYTDNDTVKYFVTTYGAVNFSFYWSSLYWNATTKSFYNYDSSSPNHEIAIVGWNDNYDKNKFTVVPPGNGAFICRNSWGTSWGESGYFYMSYYDATLQGLVSFNNAEAVSNYKAVYQYDPLGWVWNNNTYSGTTGWGANIFTATASQAINAVGFITNDANTAYTIYVYKGVTAGQPRSGTLAATKTGTNIYPGYYTVKLDAPVSLTNGQKFSVVLKVINTSYTYPIVTEGYMAGYASNATSNVGDSFYSPDGNTWNDFFDWGYNDNNTLKAFVASAELYIFDGHDFNGDGGSDVSVYRPSNNFWYIKGVGTYQWGTSGDKPVSGDYDNDGKTDVAIFRASTGKWIIRRSSTGTALSYTWGASGDTPVPADYDGDGQTDVAVWSGGINWIIKGSAGTGMTIPWGANGDIPVPGDYGGDGKADIAVFRQSNGNWYIRRSSGGSLWTVVWGGCGDIAVPADYDGDGLIDVAVYRESTGKWYVKGSKGTNFTYTWGQSGDTPAPGDYDNDGKADVAIFRASAGKWMIKGSAGTNFTYTWGANGDVALVK